MSYEKNINSSETDQNQDQTCVVCFKNVDIYSIGVCDHPVCYECSTRMRVLCCTNECPICRRDMPKVIFSRSIEPFAVLEEKSRNVNLKDAKFGFYFLSASIQRAYYRLLEHECFICRKYRNSGFRTFQQLREHMRKEHELFYCDLCVENLKIFTWERKCYTRAELGTHRRKGDADNTSHRGHPLCAFCDTRFIDNDDLFRHLRREHYFCHFCDADCKHHYYNSYSDLRKHYLEEHYLCEEGDCKYERFTSVFRTDIDLKAHITSAHGKSLSKAATKQARTLELEFTLAPRSRPGGGIKGRRRGDCYNQDDEEGAVGYRKYNVEPGGPDSLDSRNENFFVNPLNAENFPSLSGETSASTNTRTVSNVTITSKKLNPFSEENFPSLGGSSSVPPRSSAVTITTTSNKFNPKNPSDFPSLGSAGSSRQPPGLTITRTVKQPSTSRNLNDFPSLSETAGPSTSTVRLSVNSNQDRPQSAKTSNVSIHVNHKANGVITTRISQTPTSSVSVSSKTSSPDDFPALSKALVPVPQWVPQKPKKQHEPKASKVAPAPTLPTNSLNDFPTLNKNDKGRKTASVTMPISNTWVNLNNYNNQVKNNKSNNHKNNTNQGGDGSNEGPESEKKQQKGEKKGGNKNSNKNNEKSSGSKNIILTNSNVNSKSREHKNDNQFANGNNIDESKNKNKKKKGKAIDGMNSDNDRKGMSTDNCTNPTQDSESNNRITKKETEETTTTKKGELLTKNGIVKKRSELKIDSLETNVMEDNFPALGKPKPPPGFKVKPPPGFSNFDSLMNSISLYESMSSSPTPNDLTFTNSSGQSYPILPTNKVFLPPPDFQFRNRILFEKFIYTLKGNDTIQQFKILSELFRNGSISATNYYEHCQKMMGNDFKEIFPELLALLPDIDKQQELYKEHARNGSTSGLDVCANCKQVVLANELRQHLANHTLENHFPLLESPANNTDNVWNKNNK